LIIYQWDVVKGEAVDEGACVADCVQLPAETDGKRRGGAAPPAVNTGRPIVGIGVTNNYSLES